MCHVKYTKTVITSHVLTIKFYFSYIIMFKSRVIYNYNLHIFCVTLLLLLFWELQDKTSRCYTKLYQIICLQMYPIMFDCYNEGCLSIQCVICLFVLLNVVCCITLWINAPRFRRSVWTGDVRASAVPDCARVAHHASVCVGTRHFLGLRGGRIWHYEATAA